MARVAKSPALETRRGYPGASTSSSSIPSLPARSASSRARLTRSLDFILNEFLQEYPLLEGMVYMEMPGQWIVLGRQVVQIREAPLKGVLVDGLQRPLGDVLEEVLKEHQLAISMQAESQRSQRLLSHVFQHRDRQAVRRLLQAAWRGFQAVALSGRRVRHAVVRRWLILLRNSFLHWRGRVWRQHRRLQDLEMMGDRHAAPLFRGLLWYAWHSWMAVAFQPKNQELSFRQREMLLSTVRAMKDVPETELTREVFQRWRLQVQNDRRTLAEQVLLADAGRLRRNMATLKRNASAKELLSRVLDGPEAQLSRLDTVVEQLIGQMDAVKSGGLTRSLRLAQSGASSPVSPERRDVIHEALLGMGSMLEAQKAASTLRSDIQFVLCLRCVSAWMRFVSEERIARREADLGARRTQQRTRLQGKAHDLGSHMAKMAYESRLRGSFQQWERLVREGREALRSNRERTLYAQQLWSSRAVAKDRAMRQAMLWEGRNKLAMLQLILERWRAPRTPKQAAQRSAEPRWNTQDKDDRRLALKSILALGSSAGLRKVTDQALLQHTFKVWQMKTKSFKTAALQVAARIKGCEVIYLRHALLGWRDARRKSKAKTVSYKVAAFGDARALSTCLHSWHSMVQRERWQLLRSNSKVNALRLAGQKICIRSEVLLQVVLSRWLEVVSVQKTCEAKTRATHLRRLQERSKQVLFEMIHTMDVAVLWAFLKEWHAVARLSLEERKTATEYLRRQRLLDVERRHLHFQTEIRPKIRESVGRVAEASEAMNAAEVFDQWKLRALHHRLVLQTLRRAEIRELLDVRKVLLEAWRCGCVRSWLRGAGLRLGQAVVHWGNAAVLQASLATWRTICLKHHAQFTARQLFAAESIGRAIGKSQRNALRHWSAQVLRLATAQMQNKVKKLDMLYLASLFSTNVDAEVKHRHWCLRSVFEAWRLGRQQMMLERTVACPKGLTAEGWIRQSHAICRLARWRHLVPEEMLASLPETFAVWVIATIQKQMVCRLKAGRTCAWRIQQRAVTLQRQGLLFRVFGRLKACVQRRKARQRSSCLCQAAELFSKRHVLLQWSQVLHSKWKSRTSREKDLFKVQATQMVRRVLRLAAWEHSSSFLHNFFLRWRQMSLKSRHLLRHQAERCGQRFCHWDDQRLKAKIFSRWARSSFFARKESLMSPKAVTFTAWKAFYRGLRAAEEVNSSEGPQLRQLEGPNHAALVLRMALLRRCLRTAQLRGVEAVLEVRRQRQALCFGLWRLRCRFHRLHQSALRPRPGRGLQTSLLRAAFALWAHRAERTGAAHFRRWSLLAALGRVTMRTLATGFREVLLRTVWMSWFRACH